MSAPIALWRRVCAQRCSFLVGAERTPRRPQHLGAPGHATYAALLDTGIEYDRALTNPMEAPEKPEAAALLPIPPVAAAPAQEISARATGRKPGGGLTRAGSCRVGRLAPAALRRGRAAPRHPVPSSPRGYSSEAAQVPALGAVVEAGAELIVVTYTRTMTIW